MKQLLFLIFAYILAFSINLIPSIKYPDTTMHVWHIAATLLFLVALLVFLQGQSTKIMQAYLIVGVLSGVIVYVIHLFENAMFNNFLLDSIAAIQYPFFLLYSTPLFGLNLLFNIGYAPFSLSVSGFYLIAFLFFKIYKAKYIRGWDTSKNIIFLKREK